MPPISYDPRVNRVELPDAGQLHQENALDQWQNYEVFQQMKRGEQHHHVGAVHAPNPEMALLFAKEQFGRREQCANLWVVKSAEVYATEYDDADMFQHAFDKSYREGDGYKVRDTIESFKRDLDARLGLETAVVQPGKAAEPLAESVAQSRKTGDWEVIELPDIGKGPRKIWVKAR